MCDCRISEPNSGDFECCDCCLYSQSRHQCLKMFVKKIVKMFTKRKIIILIGIFIFNVFVADASPTHRARHHHHEYEPDPTTVPRCEEVQEKPRCRREVSNSMTLKDGENSTLCPNVVCIDEDLNRRPVHIYQVVCQQCGSACLERGDYRCTQLYNVMEVWYSKNHTHGGNHVEEWTQKNGHHHHMTQSKYRVKYGCVCAAAHGRHAVTHTPNVEQ